MTMHDQQQSDSHTTYDQHGQHVGTQYNAAGDIYHEEHRHYVLSTHDRQNRQRMLNQVRTFWVEGVLDTVLFRDVWSPLALTLDPQSIAAAGALAAGRATREPQALPAGTSIAQVFHNAGQHMLMLGAPGGGKTTLLLELARSLLDEAAYDERQPMPVVFNLSSWAQQHLPLERWLVQELRDQYGVGRRLAQEWIEQRAILPLLDGLDEVTAPRRAACVEAINTFRREQGSEGLVVCSRLADYRAIGVKLELDEAVVVQPLDDAQLDAYLARAGEHLAGVRAVLAQDAELQRLVRVPLLLNIVSLAYQGERPDDLLGSPPAEQRRRLFGRYVQQMLERSRQPEQLEAATPPRYTPQQTVHWLAWLAGRLQQNSQTVFQMELMQPRWLGRWWQRALYIPGAMCAAAISYALIGILFGLMLGFFFGLALEMSFWLFPEAAASGTQGIGMLSGGSPLSEGPTAGFAMGVLLAPSAALIVALLASLGQIAPPWQRRWYPWAAGLLGAGMVALLFWAISWSWEATLFWAAFVATPIGIAAAVLVQRGDIQPTEALRWSWRALRMRWCMGPVFGLISGLVFAVGFGVYAGPVSGLILGLGFAPVVALVFLLVSGLTSTEVQARSHPNAGMWRSLHRALAVWLMVGLIIGLVITSLGGIFGELNLGLLFGLIIGGLAGPAASLYFGGLAFVQHWALRLVCTLSGSAPWRYTRFLDYASERILLRRVGGSYIFIHRMLLEYFAAIEHEHSKGQQREHARHSGHLQ